MGKKARRARESTERRIRAAALTQEEQERLQEAVYEGSPYHKRNPGDFGLSPPAAPRPDATLCDEAGILRKEEAEELFKAAQARALVSEAKTNTGYPRQMWVVAKDGRVFECMYGGSRDGRYHGYPVRRSDPLFDKITKAWSE